MAEFLAGGGLAAACLLLGWAMGRSQSPKPPARDEDETVELGLPVGKR